MKYLIRLVLLLVFWLPTRAFGQPTDRPTDLDALVKTLRTQLFEGNKTALRDLISLLDKPPAVSSAARSALRDACFFSKTSPDFPTTKQLGLDFFYQKKEQLFFDELLDAWLVQSLDSQQVAFKIEPFSEPSVSPVAALKMGKERLPKALAQRDTAAIYSETERLAALDLTEAHAFLLAVSKKMDGSSPRWIFSAMARALEVWPSDEAIDLLLVWSKKGWLDGDDAEYALSVLTNHYLGTNVAEVQAQRIKTYRDSMHTLEAIRQAGFDAMSDARPQFFAENVDFWGRILSLSGNLPWVRRNATLELIRTRHPRALFYLATTVFKFRENARFRTWRGVREEAISLVAMLTRQTVEVADSTGKFMLESKNQAWLLHFSTFWAAHWSDFEWDERRGFFTNRLAALSRTEEYDRLFRRLSSPNDTAALAAYLRLAEGDAAEIVPMTEQFRQIIRAFNPLLPSFKYHFLESLVQLTNFCREQNMAWRPSARLDSLTNLLDENPPPAVRYSIENQAITSLRLGDATALERLACLREHDLDFSFSASRILDRLYAAHWPELLANDAQLRLFLKKSALFSQIGTVGVCNFYLQKFASTNTLRSTDGKMLSPENALIASISAETKNRLERLAAAETDDDIKRQLDRLLGANRAGAASRISWNRFFETPDSLKINELAQLPPLDEATRRLFFKNFKKEKSPSRAARYLDWLDQNATLDDTPDLLKLLTDPRRDSSLDVPSRVEKRLEKLYEADILGTTDERVAAWLGFEKTWGKNWRDWQIRFFEQRLSILSSRDSLSIDDLNRVTQSPLFQPLYKNAVLDALCRVRPAASIKRLQIFPKLVAPADLSYFEHISLTFKELDDVARLFQTDEPVPLLRYFMGKSAAFKPVERGVFFNEILRQDWLRAYLNGLDQPNELTKALQKTLAEYLELEDLSEFEEQAAFFNQLLLENIGLSFSRKLAATLTLDLDEMTRGKLQREILAGIPWVDLANVALIFEKLAPTERGEPAYSFLTKDFGLPPLDYAQNPENQEFITILESKSEAEVMEFYLQKFGIELRGAMPGGELDWQKIADILTFDIITPFAGGGGERRDWTVFGTIKILEKHFGTRLGYAEKLNENQTFYTFNAAKRAAAWLRVLTEKGLLSQKSGGAGAFIRVQ